MSLPTNQRFAVHCLDNSILTEYLEVTEYTHRDQFNKPLKCLGTLNKEVSGEQRVRLVPRSYLEIIFYFRNYLLLYIEMFQGLNKSLPVKNAILNL